MRVGIGTRVLVLGAGWLTSLFVLHVLLERYEPEPNGFRFTTVSTSLAIAISLLPPVIVGLFAARRAVIVTVAVIQAASPLLLLGNLRDPDADLALAVLLWWFPLPLVVGVVVVVDRLWSRRCARN